MAESIVLLVGGTKMLERELQTAIAAPLVSLATMEEATKVWTARPVRLVVLGPTLRRALQVVSMLRSEGNQESQILVVYRDDQRDEVKRHQKGKGIADAYIAQSRIQRELAETARKLWATLATGEHDLVEELPPDAVAVSQDSATQLMDVLALPDDEDEPPPPPDELLEDADGEAEVLGALDLQEVDAGDDLVEELAVEDFAIEEVSDPQDDEAKPPLATNRDDDAAMVVLTMENSILEDLPSDDELDAKATPPAAPNGASADALDLEEIDLTTDLIEELAADDAIEEIVDADLVQELHEEPIALAELEPEPEPDAVVVVPDLPVAGEPAAAGAHSAQESAVVLPVPTFAAAQDRTPETRPAEVQAPPAPAKEQVGVADPRPAVPTPAPVATPLPTAVTQPAAKASGAHAAMFSELTTFVERLQDAANSIARLEAENEHLRSELAHAQAAARPEVDAELTDLRGKLDEVRLRLTGAEHARDAAVEARMRAEQSAATRDDELARLRSELSAAQAAVATANASAAALGAQLAAGEAQAEARRKVAADAARSLHAIAGMLES